MESIKAQGKIPDSHIILKHQNKLYIWLSFHDSFREKKKKKRLRIFALALKFFCGYILASFYTETISCLSNNREELIPEAAQQTDTAGILGRCWGNQGLTRQWARDAFHSEHHEEAITESEKGMGWKGPYRHLVPPSSSGCVSAVGHNSENWSNLFFTHHAADHLSFFP